MQNKDQCYFMKQVQKLDKELMMLLKDLQDY